MATELRLPDMGEGVNDVTISAWRVNEGDTVVAGDVVLEVATDKVDTEIPANAAGTVLKLFYGEGEIVPVSAVFAAIGEPGESVGATSDAPAGENAIDDAADIVAESTAPSNESAAPIANGVKASPVAIRVASDKEVALESIAGTGPGGRITKDDVLSHADANGGPRRPALPAELAEVASLSVRRVAADHNIELDAVAAGRPLSVLTRYDVMDAVATRDGVALPAHQHIAPVGWGEVQASEAKPAGQAKAESASASQPAPARTSAAVEVQPDEELVKHSRMRTAVARTTSQSAFTAPHVTTMWDVNMSATLAHRKAHKAEFEAAGVNLTVTAYFIAAIVEGLKAVPAANASWTDEGVIIKRTFNIGMAAALPMDKYGMGGLIVPVIKHAGDLNLLGLARAVNDYAAKARAGELGAADLADGTFTLSNYGTSGSRFQTPVIVQPQVGILGVGAIEKRPVVVSQGHPLEANTGDYLAFLPMTTLGFSYDHRVLDGATADAFCAAVKSSLEGWTIAA